VLSEPLLACHAHIKAPCAITCPARAPTVAALQRPTEKSTGFSAEGCSVGRSGWPQIRGEGGSVKCQFARIFAAFGVANTFSVTVLYTLHFILLYNMLCLLYFTVVLPNIVVYDTKSSVGRSGRSGSSVFWYKKLGRSVGSAGIERFLVQKARSVGRVGRNRAFFGTKSSVGRSGRPGSSDRGSERPLEGQQLWELGPGVRQSITAVGVEASLGAEPPMLENDN